MSAHAGAVRWLEIHDELLRGLAHTLSNRVATLHVAAYMLQFAGVDNAAQAATLNDETETLGSLLQAMRMLPRSTHPSAEPAMPGDGVRGALELLAHHNELCDTPCDVEIADDILPVLVDPLALRHALLVTLAAAARAVGRSGRVRLHLWSDADTVYFDVHPSLHPDLHPGDTRADGDRDRDTAADAAAIAWLLAPYGGACSPSAHGGAFTLPSLAAARRAGR